MQQRPLLIKSPYCGRRDQLKEREKLYSTLQTIKIKIKISIKFAEQDNGFRGQ